MQARKIRIGTRGSPLALAQAHETRDRLVAAHGFGADRFEIVIIKTSGDRIQDRPLAEAGGKGLFTKEIEEALIGGDIDLAVHSMKDMPTVLPEGLGMVAILPREDVRDAFISLKWPSLAAMPKGVKVGTSSLRREAQLRRLRPDLEVVGFRGNVQTRLKKLADGVADATFLACAGLRRLGHADRITEALSTEVMLPAVAQGAIGIEARLADVETGRLLARLDDMPSRLAVEIERAFLARLEGSCRTPIAALATLSGSDLTFKGEILTPDGRVSHATSRAGLVGDGVRLAVDAAEELLGRAGPGFFTAGG
ncbi:MAG: hydroxymethylbilane synthase [Proteobacteria bacterium]|nr:hydroxymethylbilane synthase [Pseudomonadota bacterium]